MAAARSFESLSTRTRFVLRDPQELWGLSSVEQLKVVADDLAAEPDAAVRAGAALEIFGRSGAEFLVLCTFEKADRDMMIDAYLRTFGWSSLFDWAQG